MSPSLILQFVRARGFASGEIGYFGGGLYSHVDIVWPDGRLYGARSDVITINALKYPKGVQFRPEGYSTKWVKITRIEIPCTLVQQRRANTWAMSQVGAPYDHMAIVSFAIDRNWRTEGAWICSELATRYLEVGLDFDLPLTPNKINPGTAACIAGTCRALQLTHEDTP